MRKIKYILRVFIFAVIPVAFFLMITSRIPVFYGIQSYTVVTGSMEPNLHVGSIVFTQPESSYEKGDIITFKRGQTAITHRIFGIKDGKFQTKGDANESADPELVNRSDVIGKDIHIVPYIGRFTMFLKTIPGFLLFLGLPTFIFVGFELHSIKREIEKRVEEKVRSELSLRGEQI